MANDAFHTEEITHAGRRFLVSLFYDDSSSAPWENGDGHGPVRFISDRESLARGEIVLHNCNRGRYVYDFGAAIVQAARDKWGLSPDSLAKLTQRLGKKPTRAQIRAQSVRDDVSYLRGWCDDDWRYCGVCVQVIGADGEPVGDKFDHAVWGVEYAVWGVESCGDYWRTVADDLASEIMSERATVWRAALIEARAKRYWASRDVSTID